MIETPVQLDVPSAEEQLAELQIQYVQAIRLLREIKRQSRQFYRSGNPGRKDAGSRLLQLFELNPVNGVN